MSAEPKLPRWTESGSDAPAELQELLRTGRAPLGTTRELAQLSQGLAGLLQPAVGLSAAPLAAAAASSGLKLSRWLAWAAAGVGGAAAVWYLTTEPASAPPPSQPPAPHSQPIPAEPPAAEPLVAVPVEQVVAEPTPEVASAARNKAPRSAPRSASGSSEAELLRRAQSLLGTNPARALELTAEHQRRHRNGVLTEEREALAIEALRRLGRTQAAQRRAAAFEQHYPNSVHASRVRGTLPPAAP